jgi:hypothetical protein
MAPPKVLMVSITTLLSLSLSLFVVKKKLSYRNDCLWQIAEKPSIALSIASTISGGQVKDTLYLCFLILKP